MRRSLCHLAAPCGLGLARPLEAVAACRHGCLHCCHTPVTISSIEADLIGRHAGVTLAKPVQAVSLQTYDDLNEATAALAAISAQVEPSPCPFLSHGTCTVYDVRPMACRLLLNLDDDSQCVLPAGPAGRAVSRHPGLLSNHIAHRQREP